VQLALTVSVFALTYALIAARRLRWLPIGRPAGALLGAVLMVAIGTLTPEQAYDAVDHDTIVLLLGMMLITAYLERAGAFERIATAALSVCRSGFQLLAALALVSGALSAFLVNDTVCLFLTPVVVATCRRAGLPMGPYLIALATSANLGSSATLVGNPQNMIIGSLSGIPFARFAAVVAPVAAVTLLLNVGLLWAMYRRQLPDRLVPLQPLPLVAAAPLAPIAVVTGSVVVGFFAGLHLGFVALGGAVAMMLFERTDPRDVLGKVDWALLLFFACLFVTVHGFATTGLVEQAWAALSPQMDLSGASGLATYTGMVVAGSNLVSNVPLVLLAGPHVPDLGGEPAWLLLAYVSTVAGNLTLVGSVANLIVAEGARDEYPLGFWEYLKFGLPSTLLSLAVGVPLLWFLGG
jgi:Na+/H+ antiporter NhaD/arsenite permease-like protein